MEAAVLISRARILSFSPSIDLCHVGARGTVVIPNYRIGHIYDVSFGAHDSEIGDIVVRLSVRGDKSKNCQ